MLRTLTFILLILGYSQQGFAIKPILAKKITLNEEQILGLRQELSIKLNKRDESLSIVSITANLYPYNKQYTAFVSLAPFESSKIFEKKLVFNCESENASIWECKRTEITTLFVGLNKKPVVLKSRGSIDKAYNLVNRFLASRSFVVEDENGELTTKFWKETVIDIDSLRLVEIFSNNLIELSFWDGYILRVEEKNDNSFRFVRLTQQSW